MRIARHEPIIMGAVVALAPIGRDQVDLTRQLRPEPTVESQNMGVGPRKVRAARSSTAATAS